MIRERSWGAVALCVVFAFTQAVFAHASENAFWSERRAARRAHDLGTAGPRSLRELSLETRADRPPTAGAIARWLNLVPPGHVVLREVAGDPSGPGPLVIHLLDIHRNTEAQAHLAAAVRALGPRVDLIALEGSDRALDLRRFRRFHDRTLLARVVDDALARHDVSGPVQAALLAPDPSPPVVGLEETDHYRRHALIGVEALARRPAAQADWNGRRAHWRRRLGETANPRLCSFASAAATYADGALPLSDRADAILGANTGHPVPPDLQNFAVALRLERSLDFPQVKTDRADAIDALTRRLTPADARALVDLSVAQRVGRLSYGTYYARLRTFFDKADVPLGSYPALAEYLRYVETADRIDAKKLFRVMDDVEDAVGERLCRNGDERRLWRELRWMNRERRLIDLALTPDEWNDRAMEPTPPSLRPFTAFYHAAAKRDEVMADRLQQLTEALPPRPGHRRTVLLITGGFHAPGLANRLTRRGASVVSLSPRMSDADPAAHLEALGVFAAEKSPLEILFEGERLTLSPDPAPRPVLDFGLAADAAAASGRAEDFDALAAPAARERVTGSARTIDGFLIRFKSGAAWRSTFRPDAPAGRRFAGALIPPGKWRRLFTPRTGDRPPSPAPWTPRPSGRPPRVAILVLTHNATADTVTLIERLAALPASESPWELLVVDNASQDAPAGTLARAVGRVPSGRLLTADRNTGAAEGRNIGLRALLDRPVAERPDYVLLLDSDVVPAASTLTDLVAAAESSPAARVAWAPPLHFASAPDRIWRNWYRDVWRRPGQWSSDRGDGVPVGERATVDGVATAAVLVRLEAFERYGLFTAGYFFGNEDRDWCARVRKAGAEIAMAPVREKILHNVHQSLEGDRYGNFSPLRTYYILRSMMLIFVYRSPLAEKTWLRLAETALALLRVGKVAAQTRNPRVLAAAAAGLLDGLRGRDGEGRGPRFRSSAAASAVRAMPSTRRFLAGVAMIAAALTALVALTIDWSASWTPAAAAFIGITLILNWGVGEMILTMFLSAYPPPGREPPMRADYSDGISDAARTAIAYMLRASRPEGAEEAFDNMRTSYLNNLDPLGNLSAVLVSASTRRDVVMHELDLRDRAREEIRRLLTGEIAARRAGSTGDPRDGFWRAHEARWEAAGLSIAERDIAAREIIDGVVRNFKYLHRTSTLLRKPGQYLDFMALAARGWDRPFTYVGPNQRDPDQPTFGARGNIEPPYAEDDPELDALELRMASDIEELRDAGAPGGGRHRPYRFTVLMDADNRAPPGSVARLVGLGAANPERGFFQPGLLPARLRTWTQLRGLLTHRWMSRLPQTQFRIFGRFGAYGKGLANNDMFIDRFIGTPKSPRETLPPDILSHDTIEALFLNPGFTDDVWFLEDTPANAVGRHEQAVRWTIGDLLNAAYLLPGSVGRLLDALGGETVSGANRRPPWRWNWPAGSGRFTFEALYIAHYPTRIFIQAPLFVMWIFATSLSTLPNWPIAHVHPDIMLISFLIVTVGLVVLPKVYRPARQIGDGLRSLRRGDGAAAARSFNSAAREILIAFLEILTAPFKYMPDILFTPLRLVRAGRRIAQGKLHWKVQSDSEHESGELSLVKALRHTALAPAAALAWIAAQIAFDIAFTPLVIAVLTTWLVAPAAAWLGARPLPDALRSSALFRWLMEDLDEDRWRSDTTDPAPTPVARSVPRGRASTAAKAVLIGAVVLLWPIHAQGVATRGASVIDAFTRPSIDARLAPFAARRDSDLLARIWTDPLAARRHLLAESWPYVGSLGLDRADGGPARWIRRAARSAHDPDRARALSAAWNASSARSAAAVDPGTRLLRLHAFATGRAAPDHDAVIVLEIVRSPDLPSIAETLARVERIVRDDPGALRLILAGDTPETVAALRRRTAGRAFASTIARPVATEGALDPGTLLKGIADLGVLRPEGRPAWVLGISAGIRVPSDALRTLGDDGLAGSLKKALLHHLQALLREPLRPIDIDAALRLIELVQQNA